MRPTIIKSAGLMVLLPAVLFCVSAKQHSTARQTSADNTSADSMSYDFKIEWKLFSSAEPIKAFALAQNGVWYVTASAVVFQGYAKTTTRKEFPQIGKLTSAADVTCIAVDAAGSAWVGTSAGCARENNGAFTPFTKAEGLCDNDVKKIVVDKSGVVYAGTADGLCRYAGGAWKGVDAKSGFNAKVVFDLALDGQGNLWCATNNGIFCQSGGRWQSFTTANGLSYDDAHALACDPKSGKIWAAVGEKDVNCYDGKSWKVFMDVMNNIVSIMTDTQSRIWFGSATVGLLKFNGEEWVNDPHKTGMAASSVNAMQRDGSGNLWFATDKGLLCMNNPYPY
ncbi:MAG: two-component regulator propeller domain-containing protein [Chitinivibrionales bacterium]|nr:two-component regulator propeller domain-containing protein [Chitinivibrionales bacterium]